jgi:hypothetical protein
MEGETNVEEFVEEENETERGCGGDRCHWHVCQTLCPCCNAS